LDLPAGLPWIESLKTSLVPSHRDPTTMSYNPKSSDRRWARPEQTLGPV